MGALVLALVIWRGDMVRLLPQTAAFYRMVGLEVNLRGLAFKDVKLSSETVDGKQVLVIEGVIVGQTRSRSKCRGLRFCGARRAGRGNLRLEHRAGTDRAQARRARLFRSRLASPPPEGRNIDVRFFNRARHGRRPRMKRFRMSARTLWRD